MKNKALTTGVPTPPVRGWCPPGYQLFYGPGHGHAPICVPAGLGADDNEVGWHEKMGRAGFILRAQDEPCFVNCKYDWIRAGTVAVIAGLSVSGSVKKGGWWKGGLASLGGFFATNMVLTLIPRGAPDIPVG